MGRCCCNCWHRFWEKHDPDDVFSYSTIKVVKVRDRILGMTYYSFLFAIVVYVVIYAIVLQKGYLLRVPVSGESSFFVKYPNDKESTRPALPEPTTLPYCSQSSLPYLPDQKQTCGYFEPDDINFPVGEAGAIFLTTRVSRTSEYLPCEPTEVDCVYEIIGSDEEDSLYVADVENYFLRVQHHAVSERLNIFGNSQNMYGGLYKRTCASCWSWSKVPEYQFEPPRTADSIPIKAILEAGYVDLDSYSDRENKGKKVSVRYQGQLILLELYYTNIGTRGDMISYQYRPIALPVDFKAEEVIYNTFPTNRTILNRHGIRLVVLESGQFGAFNFQALLIQLTTSLALLGVAHIVVDSLAKWVMPHRAKYKEHMFEITEDFSDLRDRLVLQENPKDERVETIEKYKKPIFYQSSSPLGDSSASPDPAS